jgi:hypothetical protein
MARQDTRAGEVTVKIAIIGQALSGKKNIIHRVAGHYDQSALRSMAVSQAEIIRTEFIWPEPVSDGPFIRVRMLALSGKPVHQAGEQLLLADCDALVFVVDCNPSSIAESRSALRNLMTNAGLTGLNWAQTKLILQYNKAESYPNIKPEDLDSWLGINTERVERFLTHSDNADHQVLAVDAAIRGVIATMTGPSPAKAVECNS